MTTGREVEISPRGVGAENQGRKEQDLLTLIIKKLKANKKLYYVGRPTFDPSTLYSWNLEDPEFESKLGFSKNLSIIVAPTKPIFDIAELSSFVDSLAKDLNPSDHDRPHSEHIGGVTRLRLGMLEFHELVGTILTESKSTITIINRRGFRGLKALPTNTCRSTREDLKRTITVWVFPDILSAGIASTYASGAAKQEDGVGWSSLSLRGGPPYITSGQIKFLENNQGMDLSTARRMTQLLTEEHVPG